MLEGKKYIVQTERSIDRCTQIGKTNFRIKSPNYSRTKGTRTWKKLYMYITERNLFLRGGRTIDRVHDPRRTSTNFQLLPP